MAQPNSQKAEILSSGWSLNEASILQELEDFVVDAGGIGVGRVGQASSWWNVAAMSVVGSFGEAGCARPSEAEIRTLLRTLLVR